MIIVNNELALKGERKCESTDGSSLCEEVDSTHGSSLPVIYSSYFFSTLGNISPIIISVHFSFLYYFFFL